MNSIYTDKASVEFITKQYESLKNINIRDTLITKLFRSHFVLGVIGVVSVIPLLFSGVQRIWQIHKNSVLQQKIMNCFRKLNSKTIYSDKNDKIEKKKALCEEITNLVTKDILQGASKKISERHKISKIPLLELWGEKIIAELQKMNDQCKDEKSNIRFKFVVKHDSTSHEQDSSTLNSDTNNTLKMSAGIIKEKTYSPSIYYSLALSSLSSSRSENANDLRNKKNNTTGKTPLKPILKPQNKGQQQSPNKKVMFEMKNNTLHEFLQELSVEEDILCRL